MIESITNLGDAALLLPASALVFGYLCWRGDRSRALSFALAIGACLVITLFAKLACILLGVACSARDLQSPSGHAAFSAAFYGCCAALIVPGGAVWRRRLVWAGALALIVAIALSRVWVGAHSLLEVAIGLVIGFGCVRLFLRLAQRGQGGLKLVPLALGLAVLAIGLQGSHFTIEPLLQVVADRLGLGGEHKCSPPGSLAAWHVGRGA